MAKNFKGQKPASSPNDSVINSGKTSQPSDCSNSTGMNVKNQKSTQAKKQNGNPTDCGG